MKSQSAFRNISGLGWVLGVLALFVSSCGPAVAQQTTAKSTPVAGGASVPAVREFSTPQEAAKVLIEAADTFNVPALTQIFGPNLGDVIFSGEFGQDRKHAADFVAEAREKNSVSVDPRSGNRAFLLVGNEDWPFPIPIVKTGTKWVFDTKAGGKNFYTAESAPTS